MDWLTSFTPEVWAVWRMKNSSTALSLAVTPSSGMVHRRELRPVTAAEPLLGIRTLVMTKSGFTTSSMTMSVAPGLEMLAARSAKSCSRSAASGVTATWAASGSVAHSFRALTSTPSEPTSPMA